MTENDLMLTSILDCRRVDLALNKGYLTSSQKLKCDLMKARRAEGEPLQYILGQCDFMGTALSVDQRALIPRPETEILVDLAIEKIKSMREEKTLNVLDLGVGSGNITIALLKNIVNITITALDISDDALALAKENASANYVEQKIQFSCRDMLAYLKDSAHSGKMFDVIVSNPPYIPAGLIHELPEDVRREPRIALDGGEDGLRFYRTIIEYGWQILDPKGFLIMEIGDGQHDTIESIFARYPRYAVIHFYKDYVGTKRVVIARMDAQWKN